MGSFDFEQYQRKTTELVARTCHQTDSLKPILQTLQDIADGVEVHIEAHPSDRSQIDCGPGCSSCCVVNVSTLLPEGFAIARYVRQRGEEWSRNVIGRLDSLWQEVRGVDDDDRMFMQRSCAFLDARGNCSIYPVRPLLCRAVTSTSEQSCRDALAGKVLGEETSVLMHQFQQNAYETLFNGVAAGVEECGLDGRSLQLSGLLRYLLKHPGAEQDWLAGKRLTWQDIY